ncbi:MAG: hypothetical protein IKZ13_04665 [Akkermansia sp.]|nr:hypothetical protein [Akkermansia sp.]
MLKSRLLTLATAVCLLGGVLPAEAQHGGVVSVPGVTAWSAPDKLRAKLAAEITELLPGLENGSVSTFVQRARTRRLLLMYYIACSEESMRDGYKNYNNSLTQNLKNKQAEVERLEKEVREKKGPEADNAEFRLSQALADCRKLKAETQYPVSLSKCENVLKAMMTDAGWLEQIVFSGEMRNFSRVVQMIDAIADGDPNALRKGVERDTTTAVALEYAKGNEKVVDAVARARYFLKYWRQGRLNTSFDSLPMHQRRVVCGWKPFHSSGNVKAFEWALNNVHLPDWQYPASCWRCGYISDNVYGDSVQGPWYAAPFHGVYTDNHMAFTRYVGGVCGGLSHFGAASACANGVPSLTAGEPGHCAYIVLVNGRWTPAYSLSWERGLHWIPWDGNYTYSSLHLTDDLFAEAATKSTRLSNAYRILARLFRDRQEPEKALACFEASAKAAPLNYPMWREYADFLADKMSQNKQAWQKLNAQLCAGMAPVYPEQAAELLKQKVYGRMGNCGMSANELAAACALFWKHASVMGPDRWYIERFADEQMRMCRAADGGSEAAAIALFSGVLQAAAPHDAYSGTMMAWGNGVSESLSEEGRKALSDSMVKALSSGSELNSAQRAKLLGSLILAAERKHDDTTFRAISSMIDPKEIHGTAAIPAPTPFPGKLVSEGGMPFASSTSEWDAPHTHSGLLTQQGGTLHTGRDNNAWIAVKLPRHAYISGVVFAGTNVWDLIHRFRPLRVQVSDTGRDDDWHDVGAPIERTDKYINRFDLQKERPKALYVRVLRSGGPEFFHANGIYVYGEPAA